MQAGKGITSHTNASALTTEPLPVADLTACKTVQNAHSIAIRETIESALLCVD